MLRFSLPQNQKFGSILHSLIQFAQKSIFNLWQERVPLQKNYEIDTLK
jgi:hypothetical protein